MPATALPSTGLPADGWLPCSDRSLERNDPLAGTGGFGERWFLIEVDGSWGTHALLQSKLDARVARPLVKKIEAAGMRPLAIRRIGRRADERRAQTLWRWAIVDARPDRESVHWGSVTDPADLLDVPLDGSTGVPSDEPIICVCTHARHDQCCAVKGRPVANALQQAYPEHTWECSHLGGDRFAATMIVFPEGLYYGRVPASEAAELVATRADGRVDDRYFRGRSSLPTIAQAAEHHARVAFSDDRIDAFSLLGLADNGGSWTVNLQHGEDVVSVDLMEELSVPLLSTCGATTALPVRQYVLETVTSRPL